MTEDDRSYADGEEWPPISVAAPGGSLTPNHGAGVSARSRPRSSSATPHFPSTTSAGHDIAGSRAHVRMLCHIGVLSRSRCDILLDGLDEVEREITEGEFPWELRDEDIHMAVERRLTELVGPVGGKVHTARSRNDQVALDLQLYLRAAVRGHLERILEVMEVLLRRATELKDTVMPGYTPAAGATGDSRLPSAGLRVHAFTRCPTFHPVVRLFVDAAGSGGAGWSELPVDRAAVARELGFERVAPNAMDAVASRDAAYEYLAVATCCALNLSRLAEEIVLWSSQEFGFLRLPDAWSSGSSIMPQKRNPDAAELIRGKAAGFVGRLTSLGTLLKGLPLAYNKDLQEDKLYVFATRDELDVCLEAAAAMAAAASLRRAPARGSRGGYAQATDVADYLVGKGLPFREAHAVAGRLVALAAAGERPLEAISRTSFHR